MDILVLRLIHIAAGVFWVGAVFAFFLFVQPAAMAIGADATKFNYRLLHHQRFSEAILAAAATTVVAGILLLAITSNGFDLDLLFDASRLGYTVGGLVAILAFAIGATYVFPRTRTVEHTIGAFLAEGRPPTSDEQQLLARTARESRSAGWLVIIGLGIAVVAMATARLWSLVI
jgi:uncharacterized membrane protein